MRVNRFRSFRSLVLAVGIHVLAIGLLIVSLDLTPPPAGQPQGTEVVQAVTVDEQKVKAEVERLEQAERRKRDEETARRRTAESELAAAKTKRQAEERRLAEVKKERDAVENAKAAEQKELEATEAKRKQKSPSASKKRNAGSHWRNSAWKRRSSAPRPGWRRRNARQPRPRPPRRRNVRKRKPKQKRSARKAKAEAEKKRQEEERRARELAEQIEAEQQAARDQSEIDRFTRLIQTQIENAFTNPQRGLKCTLLVKMVPGGDVVDAKVVRSSGNVLFDRRAEIAVHKASPLPVPDDPRLFQQMREIEFIFEPQA